MALPVSPVGGNESPQWDNKIYAQKQFTSAIRSPYLRIQIGSRDDEFDDNIKNKAMLLNQKFLNQVGMNIERYVTRVEVIESMEGADRFVVELVDPKMTIMFSEELFIGRSMFIDMGYTQGSSCYKRQMVEGPISTMEFHFTDDGLPKLTISGLGVCWGVLNNEQLRFNISFRKVPEKPSLSLSGLAPLHQRTYNNIQQMLEQVADAFGLKIVRGKTVPDYLDQYILKDVDYATNLNPEGFVTWNQYLSQLATKVGCQFYQKGRFLHFFPAAWLNAPVKRRDDMQRSIDELKTKRKAVNPTMGPPTEEEANLLAQYDAVIEAKETELSKWDLNMATTSNDGLYELNYMMGNKNMLTFKPTLTDLNTAGYIAMAMDPKTGEISFGNANVVGNDAGNINLAKRVGVASAESNLGVTYNVTPKVLDEKDLTKGNDLEEILIGLTNEEKLKVREIRNKILNKKNVPDQGPMDNAQAAAAAQASFLNWMWFAEAKAECVGDTELTCGMPVWVRGLGPRKNSNDDKTREYDSGKLCGKWYIYTVKHEITPDKMYTCDLELKRFWNYIDNFDSNPELSKNGVATNDNKTFVAENSKPTAKPSSPKVTP